MRCACLALLLLASPAAAEDVPVDVGVTLLLKVLTYDAGFEARGTGEFLVLVPNADDAALQQLATVARSKLKSRVLSFVAVKPVDLGAELKARKASAVLLFPGADDVLLADVEHLAKETQVYTLALGEDAVRAHVMLGVALKDGKPQLIINVAQSRAVGADFPQSILKVAKLVR